jgi:penicillin-binding protein 1C
MTEQPDVSDLETKTKPAPVLTSPAPSVVSRFRLWGRRSLIAGLCLVAAAGVGWLALGPLVDRLYPDLETQILKEFGGGQVLARNGEILRLLPDELGDFSLPASPGSFPLVLRQAILAAEDKRFFDHGGLDWLATLRSAWLNLKRRRVVSGASTLTQQLIRISQPSRRTLSNKIRDILKALRLERLVGKERILGEYLNRAPMGGNVRGCRLACRLLFDKEIGELTVSEAALLAAIPQLPSRMGRSPADRSRLLKRRNWVIERMAGLGFITAAQAELARLAPVPAAFRPFPFGAPHFVDWVKSLSPNRSGTLQTSLDPAVQDCLEKALVSHRSRLNSAGARQAAGMIVKTSTMEVLAMVGSLEYGAADAGFNNGCLAARSGGSILKPFLYMQALERGLNAAEMIPDTNQSFRTPQGDYLPYNADRRTYGPVTIRSALGNSLNISAVKMLNYLGIPAFFKTLVELGLLKDDPRGPETFGLGLAIGNPELRMVDLLVAYGMLAHSGTQVPLRVQPGTSDGSRQIRPAKSFGINGSKADSSFRLAPEGENHGLKAICTPEAAYVILDILSDPSARLLTFGNPAFFKFPFPVALKTGTSTNYRDSWLIGLTPGYLIGIWVGNFDGAATFGLAGATACGPIFHHLMQELGQEPGKLWFKRPANVTETPICGISGGVPTPYCETVSHELFIRSGEPIRSCPFHTRPGKRHELSGEYADWISGRRERNLPDPYTLAGGVSSVDPLSVPTGPGSQRSGVRLLNQVTPPAPTAPSAGSLAGTGQGTSPSLDDSPGIGTSGTSAVAASTGQPGASPGGRPDGGIASGSPFADTAVSGTPASTARLVIGKSGDELLPTGRITIVSPHHRDRLVMVPDGENFLKLRAIPEEAVPELIWLVDGHQVARTPPPYEAYWEMTRGEHVITVVGPSEQAHQISIMVE